MQHGQGRKKQLVRAEGREVPRCLALTSPLSDSAIFLLRSMQRDECLIPISAAQDVAPLGAKGNGRWNRCAPPSLLTSELRTFILQQINIQVPFPPFLKTNCVGNNQTIKKKKERKQQLKNYRRSRGLRRWPLSGAEGSAVQKFAAGLRVFLESIASARWSCRPASGCAKSRRCKAADLVISALFELRSDWNPPSPQHCV